MSIRGCIVCAVGVVVRLEAAYSVQSERFRPYSIGNLTRLCKAYEVNTKIPMKATLHKWRPMDTFSAR
jgi:hypothetical protein